MDYTGKCNVSLLNRQQPGCLESTGDHYAWLIRIITLSMTLTKKVRSFLLISQFSVIFFMHLTLALK